jgi:hypothetical protein
VSLPLSEFRHYQPQIPFRFDAYAAFGSISVLRPSRDRQYFFVDYSSVQEATAAVAARHVFIGDCRTFVEFARPKSTDSYAPEHSSQHVVLDWRCALCNFVNFAKVGFLVNRLMDSNCVKSLILFSLDLHHVNTDQFAAWSLQTMQRAKRPQC